MGFLDLAQVFNTALGIAIVLLPVYFLILYKLGWMQLWATQIKLEWSTPEGRAILFKDIAHGVMRAFQERAGSLKGVAVKADQAAGLDALVSGEGSPLAALGMLKGKIDIPGIGKLTPLEALQAFQSIKSLLGGKLNLGQVLDTGGSSGGSGLPP